MFGRAPVLSKDIEFDRSTLNSAYNEVAFNEKSAITKENLRTKYFPIHL